MKSYTVITKDGPFSVTMEPHDYPVDLRALFADIVPHVNGVAIYRQAGRYSVVYFKDERLQAHGIGETIEEAIADFETRWLRTDARFA